MIDVLIGLASGYLTTKKQIDEAEHADDIDEKVRQLTRAVKRISESDEQQAQVIEQMCRELQGLQPHNLNPSIEAIHEWMRQHVESEQQTFQEQSQKQYCWNVTLACGAGLALFLSILGLLK